MSKFYPVLAFPLFNSQWLPRFNQEVNLFFPVFDFNFSTFILLKVLTIRHPNYPYSIYALLGHSYCLRLSRRFEIDALLECIFFQALE